MELAHQSPENAEKSLETAAKQLSKETPEKAEEWYLEKIIEDLENDRRWTIAVFKKRGGSFGQRLFHLLSLTLLEQYFTF